MCIRDRLNNGTLLTNESGAMLYAEHHFSTGQMQITTSMHRRAGSQRESVQAVTDGGLIDVTDMREWREERGQGVVHKPIAGWQTTLEQRGFAGCARHFIACKIRRFPRRQASRRYWPSVLLKSCGGRRWLNNPL